MIIECEICKKEFYKRPSHFKRVKHDFCSRKCRGISHLKEGNPMWKDNFKECLNCYVKFKSRSSLSKFCSQVCMGEWYRKIGNVEGKCLECGKDMIIKKSLIGISKFCSKQCKNISHSRNMKAEGNPSWRGGIKNLPWGYEFNKNLKQKIKERHNYQCFLCENQKLLQVHHINYDKSDNCESNLVPLCCSCHCKTNYNRKIWKKELSKKLEDWMKARNGFTI